MTNKYPRIVIALDADKHPKGVVIDGTGIPTAKDVFVRTYYETGRPRIHEVNFTVLTDAVIEVTEE